MASLLLATLDCASCSVAVVAPQKCLLVHMFPYAKLVLVVSVLENRPPAGNLVYCFSHAQYRVSSCCQGSPPIPSLRGPPWSISNVKVIEDESHAPLFKIGSLPCIFMGCSTYFLKRFNFLRKITSCKSYHYGESPPAICHRNLASRIEYQGDL